MESMGITIDNIVEAQHSLNISDKTHSKTTRFLLVVSPQDSLKERKALIDAYSCVIVFVSPNLLTKLDQIKVIVSLWLSCGVIHENSVLWFDYRYYEQDGLIPTPGGRRKIQLARVYDILQRTQDNILVFESGGKIRELKICDTM